MRVVAHVQRRIPRPAVAPEAPGRLLAPGSVVTGRAFARRPVPGVRAPSTVQARAGFARVHLGEVPGPASAFGVRIDSDADQRRLVGVHHVRQGVYLQHVGAAALAVGVFVQTLVDADHGDVDAHLLLDLRDKQRSLTVHTVLPVLCACIYLFAVHKYETVELDRLVVRRTVSRKPDVGQRGIFLFQLNAEHVNVVPGSAEYVGQFVLESVQFAPDQTLRLKTGKIH